MSVERFEHRAADVDWYCEQRGEGPHLVLVPSGEGDCASFDELAGQLADQFTVLTFDTPGFSRSTVAGPEDISITGLGGQIAELVTSLGVQPATFYGCSSGGHAVLDILVNHPELVRNAVVHEVAMAGAAGLLKDLVSLDDNAVTETCGYLFAEVLNDDSAAWQALGTEFHRRLAPNYVTWVRRYLGKGPPPPFTPQDLMGKPLVWTIGGLTPAASFFDNVVLAVRSECPISVLMCKHFPHVSTPAMLAEHIRTHTVKYL